MLYAGIVTYSTVVIGTLPGNPHGISDWIDLTKQKVAVLYPNPQTSGGAQWNINAICGAGLKMTPKKGQSRQQMAKQLLINIQRNVISMDKSGRAAMTAFEYGIGDAIVTYENEILARKRKGAPYELIIPQHTLLIKNPVVVTNYAQKHCVQNVAQALVDYLRTPQAQRMFAKAGFRPVHRRIIKETNKRNVVW